MTKRRFILGAALAAASWLAFFGDKTPSNNIAEPVSRPTKISTLDSRNSASSRMAETTADTNNNTSLILALKGRELLIGSGHDEPHVDGLFSSHSWTPPPPPPPPVSLQPPPPPMAPSLPFTFIGKKMEDNKWEVFLAHGQKTLVAHEQSQLEGMYRVDSIKPPVMSLTYLPLNQVQTLAIGRNIVNSPANNSDNVDAQSLPDNPSPEEAGAFIALSGPQKLKVGDVFDIQITLDARQATSNYSTTISFDSNALAVANIAEGGFLKQGGVQSGFTNGMQGDGQISISGSRIDSRGITGKGMLATIRFRALAATNEAHIRVVSTSVQNSAGQRVSTALPSPFLISIQL